MSRGLPESCWRLAAPLADRLMRASLRAGETDREVAAVLTGTGRRLTRGRFLANRSDRDLHFECEEGEWRAACDELDRGGPRCKFHSHPLTPLPSVTDVLHLPRGWVELIYCCATTEFLLFRYTRKLRERARRGKLPPEKDPMWAECRLPLFVETGIESFDRTVLSGAKHRRLLADLRRRMVRLLRSAVLRLAAAERTGREVRERIDDAVASHRIDRLLDGLGRWVRFPGAPAPRATLLRLSQGEEDYLGDANDLFYILRRYEVGQEPSCWSRR